MNNFLEKFIKETFKVAGSSLDLGAGDFKDVGDLKKMGWKCEGVDLNTGVDLENIYESNEAPFDLVYSNYVLQRINNKRNFIETIYNNLKKGGWFFIHTFDKTDKVLVSDLSENSLRKLLSEQGFINVKIRRFDYYDNDPGHQHWHKILEAVGQK